MKEPRQLGRYYLTERIAKGGMAEVYRAKTVGAMGFLKDVAVKMILPEVLRESEEHDILGMFIDEAHTASALEHPNIVRVHDLDVSHGSYYMAMDFVAGQNVRTLVAQEEALPPQLAAYVIAEICGALGYAHRKRDAQGRPRNIVHRDVSPPNILISYEGEVKLIDFGVAKADDQFHETADGALKGKYAYMSPEQTRSMPLDRRSDLFSLGTVLYEMLTGNSPFRDKSILLTLQNVATAPFPRPRELCPSIPQELDAIVMKAMSRDRALRFDSAYEMQDALYQYLHTRSVRFSRHHLADWMEQRFGHMWLEEQRKQEAYAPFFAALQRQRHAEPGPPQVHYGSDRTNGQSQHVAGLHQGPAICTAQREHMVGERPSYSGPFPYPAPDVISYTGPAPTPDREALQAASEATSYAGPRPPATPHELLQNATTLAPESYAGPAPGAFGYELQGGHAMSHDGLSATGLAFDDIDIAEGPATELMPSLQPRRRSRLNDWLLIGLFVCAVFASGALAFWGWSRWSQTAPGQPQATSSCRLELGFAPSQVDQDVVMIWGKTRLRAQQLPLTKQGYRQTPALSCGQRWLIIEHPRRRPYRQFLQLKAGKPHRLEHITLPKL